MIQQLETVGGRRERNLGGWAAERFFLGSYFVMGWFRIVVAWLSSHPVAEKDPVPG